MKTVIGTYRKKLNRKKDRDSALETMGYMTSFPCMTHNKLFDYLRDSIRSTDDKKALSHYISTLILLIDEHHNELLTVDELDAIEVQRCVNCTIALPKTYLKRGIHYCRRCSTSTI